jgi:hypothetical protein
MGRLGSRQRQLKLARSKISTWVSTDLDDGRSVSPSRQHVIPNSSEIIPLDDSIEEADLEKLLAESLKWTEDARIKRAPVYTGDSERTNYRRKKAKRAMVESSKGSNDIRSFFRAVGLQIQ